MIPNYAWADPKKPNPAARSGWVGMSCRSSLEMRQRSQHQIKYLQSHRTMRN